MSGWEETELRQVAVYAKDKIDAKLLSASNYISTENMVVNKGGILASSYVPEKGKTSGFKVNDILVSNIRPYFKKIWISDKVGGCSNDIIVFRSILNKIEPKFLYYQLSKDDFFDYMMSGANGIKMPRGNRHAIPGFKVFLPPISTQRKITTILSAYDDLIVKNLRRIDLLETLARLTYEEWFVRFNVKGLPMKVNEETNLPAGWKRERIGEMIEVGRGSSPRPIADQKYFEGGTIPWLKIADATASNIFIHETKEYVNEYGASFSRKLKPGSLIVAASGTLGFPMFLSVEACIHDGWIYFDGITEELREYFYYSFIGLRKYFESISYGAAIQNINTAIVKASPFILPPQDILTEFKKFVGPIFRSIEMSQKQNILLKESRDNLLRGLMSGKIEV